MPEPLLSLSEIRQLEDAYAVGAPTLGAAAAGFLKRWQAHLRDEETLIWLVFLRWYMCSEPVELTGLGGVALPNSDDLIEQFGGEARLGAESLFVIALLAQGFPWCLGEEASWKERGSKYYQLASEREPNSLVFRNWRLFA